MFWNLDGTFILLFDVNLCFWVGDNYDGYIKDLRL